jgi:hypothetical protein
MQIRIETNIAEVQRLLGAQAKQVAYATAVALTKTAARVKAAMPAELDRVFDRPTSFTKQGTYLKMATRTNLEAEVGFKPVQAHYLQLQASGGTKQAPAAGLRLPGNIQLNAFGNIPRGLIAKLKAGAQNGTLSAAIVKRLGVTGNRRKGAAPIQLFYGQPQGKGWEKAPMGIWRRVPGVNGAKGKLIPVVVFEDTPAKYTKRLDLEAIALPIVRTHFEQEFDTALAKALATAQ